MPRNKTTMANVAERAGVSKMTVSLVLREGARSKYVSEATYARVQEVAKELKYLPDVRSKILRSGVTNVIGVFASVNKSEGEEPRSHSPFFSSILYGVQTGCYSRGQLLMLHFETEATYKPADVYAEFNSGRIDGLVVKLNADDPLLELLKDAPFPVVAVADVLPDIPTVRVDDAQGSQLLAQHLHERGHRRCIYVRPKFETDSGHRRRQAFLRSAEELGLSVQDTGWTQWNREAEELLHQWQATPTAERPTALVCWNDQGAEFFLERCRRLNIRLPEDLALVGFDGVTHSLATGSLTTIHAPWNKVAHTAVDLINQQLSGEEIPLETVLPVELVIGSTT